MAEIKIYNPAELDEDDWYELQGLSRDAFSHTLNRTQDEIDALVGWDDHQLYYESHLDPNSQVGKRYADNQEFTKPRVAVAVAARELVGFAYSAHNVSGETEGERRWKRLSIVKKYLWLRDVAVAPNFKRQHIARELAGRLLEDAMPLQPVTAYIWPQEIGFLQGTLERLGFYHTNEQDVQLFGEGSEPCTQVRMQARSVRRVLQRL